MNWRHGDLYSIWILNSAFFVSQSHWTNMLQTFNELFPLITVGCTYIHPQSGLQTAQV